MAVLSPRHIRSRKQCHLRILFPLHTQQGCPENGYVLSLVPLISNFNRFIRMEERRFRFVSMSSTISSWGVFLMGCRSTLKTPGSELPKIVQRPSSAPIRAQPGALRLHTTQQATRFAVFYQSACSRKEVLAALALSQVCSANEYPPLPRPTKSFPQLALGLGSKRKQSCPPLLHSRNRAPPLSQYFLQITMNTSTSDRVRDIVV